jgi:hypothetical protein
MRIEIAHHHYHHNEDTGQILRQLDRVYAALQNVIMRIDIMTQTTDAAIANIGKSVQDLTDTVASVSALLDGAVAAQRALAEELAAEGQDVTKLNALSDAIEAQRDVLVSKTVANTPADTGAAVPDTQPVA